MECSQPLPPMALYWQFSSPMPNCVCGGKRPGLCLSPRRLSALPHPAWPVGMLPLRVSKVLTLLHARSEQPHAQLVFTLQQLKLPATLHSAPVASGSAVLLPPDV